MRVIKPYLLPLFAVATLFPRLLSLPAPFQQVQLTELLFPLLLWAFRADLWAQIRRFPTFSAAAGLYGLVNVLSASWAGHAGAMLEAGARVYLLVVVYLVMAHIHQFGRERLLRWWTGSTVVVSVLCLGLYLGIMGWGASDPFHLLGYRPQYPYLGDVYRLRATASTYGMWVMLLLPGALLMYAEDRSPLRWVLLFPILAILPTLSKEILLIPIGLLLLPSTSGWKSFLALALAAFLLIGTHLVIVPKGGVQANAYTSTDPLISIADYSIVESVYLPIKRGAIRLGCAHPWVGVGPGEFVDYSTESVLPGELVADFGRFDPHSAWTGAFAETGLLGLLALCGLVMTLYVHRPAHLTTAAVLLLLFLLVSVFKDVMNFRGLWVVVGLYLCGREAT